MRLRSLFLWDIRFQAKYGFYFLYAVLTAIYVIALVAVPESWKEKTSAILIFSDPAAMGLFFMGAIVLLEKNQRTPCAFAVSPIRAMEYVGAKVCSLAIISVIVAAILALSAGVRNLHTVLLGTAVASAIFTLCGIITATRIISINQFILWTVPIEVAGFVPAILHLFGVTPDWFRYYPMNICMDMISGSSPSVIGILIIGVSLAILLILTRKSVLKMWGSMGGVKL